MDIHDIKFDSSLEMKVFISEQKDSVRLVISDDLALSEEEMSNEYKKKIIKMLESSAIWYRLAEERIFSEISMQGQLMAIYLLSEQNSADFVFGLLFRVEADIEHGRGMKVLFDDMKIIEYGDAEVAFC
ncbi:hypothetical protein HYE66_01635 [Aggregatibacter actinomycetemcomitans]|nr:hypothetical protein [Aggregatibacter actinomycetemcomitans]